MALMPDKPLQLEASNFRYINNKQFGGKHYPFLPLEVKGQVYCHVYTCFCFSVRGGAGDV